MSLEIQWPAAWDGDFVEDIRARLEMRLRTAMQLPAAAAAPVRGQVCVDKLELGSTPPRVTLLQVRQCTAALTQLEVNVQYSGDASVVVRGIQVNLDLTAAPAGDDADRELGDANHALPFWMSFDGCIKSLAIDGTFLIDVVHELATDSAPATPTVDDPTRASSPPVPDGSMAGRSVTSEHSAATRSSAARPSAALSPQQRQLVPMQQPQQRQLPQACAATTSKAASKPAFRVAELPEHLLAVRAARNANAAAMPPSEAAASAGGNAVSNMNSQGFASGSASPHQQQHNTAGAPRRYGAGMLRGSRGYGRVARHSLHAALGSCDAASSAKMTASPPRDTRRMTFAELLAGIRPPTADVAVADPHRRDAPSAPSEASSSTTTVALQRRKPRVVRTVRVRAYTDPVQGFSVASNLSSVVGDKLSKVLRSVIKPAIDRLMREGFAIPAS